MPPKAGTLVDSLLFSRRGNQPLALTFAIPATIERAAIQPIYSSVPEPKIFKICEIKVETLSHSARIMAGRS